MDMNENDNTIKEILKEDEQVTKNGKKKKSCLVRALIFLIILLIAFLGFIFVQQTLLDIEAEAIVAAARTSTALAADTGKKNIEETIIESTQEPEPSATFIPTETPTPDPLLKRTATVAAQLTQVAEFQMTLSPQP